MIDTEVRSDGPLEVASGQSSALAVGFIFGEKWDSHFGLSMLAVARQTDVVILSQPSGPKLDKGRNMLVEQYLALDPVPEYLLMVDTDTEFTVDQVAALYAKAMPDRIIGGHLVAGDSSPVSKIRRDGLWYSIADPGDGVVKVDYTGAAFLLVPKGVYEKVGANHPGPRPYFAFTERSFGDSDDQDMGEDAEFCLRATECGFMVLVDGSVRPGHRKVGTLGADTVPE